jgi:hypothetical protein
MTQLKGSDSPSDLESNATTETATSNHDTTSFASFLDYATGEPPAIVMAGRQSKKFLTTRY